MTIDRADDYRKSTAAKLLLPKDKSLIAPGCAFGCCVLLLLAICVVGVVTFVTR